jgi:hypothetical protein
MAWSLLSHSVMSAIGSLLLMWFGLQLDPLPDFTAFLDITRSQLALHLDEDKSMEGYTWRRRTIRDDQVTEHDVFQFDSGLYTKLVRENGVSKSNQDLRKQDSDQPFAPGRGIDRLDVIEDMFRVWKFEMAGREVLHGRPAIVVAFEPRAGAEPETRAGKWLFRNTRGVAWIDEQDHRIARIHTVVINDISLVWGLFAKVHRGSEVIREWRKLNNEAWMPSMSMKRFHGRAFMIGLDFEEIEQYSEYRRFDVETKLRFESPR